MAKANPVRKAKAFARAYGGERRVRWIQAQPCILCGASPCENAHVKGGGAGRKADARWIVPLCHTHHAQLHTVGQKSFEAAYGDSYDLHHWAQVVDARWEQYLALHPTETP
jgi:hypothetical protein